MLSGLEGDNREKRATLSTAGASGDITSSKLHVGPQPAEGCNFPPPRALVPGRLPSRPALGFALRGGARSMAPRVTSWLLLQVALLLDAAEAQGPNQFRMSPPKLVAGVGETVTLRCEVLMRNVLQGCSWLFQPHGATRSPTFLLYQSGSRPKLAPGLDEKRFTSTKSSNTYTLTVSGFREQDEGYYFCLVVANTILHFSPFLPVFLPAAPTTTPAPPPPTQVPSALSPSVRPETCVLSKGGKAAPTTTPAPPPPTQVPSALSPSVRPETCVLSKGGKAHTRWLDLTCDVYIWAPLAGTCAVLLLSLVLAVIFLRRNRRRVCKCPR
ncbi:T-cell surface glycoprotein CD8 alpha chain [Heterocephalus glaber]|uniref:T-cell surface glycoprotein CD8 alpha chain n=1 Tax=Heterocephalus glaber TaxID=10181 RepID=G5AQ07_HETGA|nr:T-cell surface glycoprotein CD8 alpha chain [Heterocephalus glaber]